MKTTLVTVLAAASLSAAQLSGRVGPTTTRAVKAAKKVCNVLSYGGVASATTDNSAAITKAWADCKAGGQVLIPGGSYGLDKWVTLAGGKGVSINLEGTLFRISNGTSGGSIIAVQTTDDFEFYSGNSKGAIQGYGYEFHKQDKHGPSLLTFTSVSNFSVHDVALVDSPASHFTIDSSSDGEVYNLAIHGGDKTGLDGITGSGTNIWVHDVAVTNGDDCVALKSPSGNILVESVFCNRSGGCSIGPLGADTNVRNIVFQNIYSQRSDHMLLIKANGGSGPFSDATFTNFTGHSNKDTLNINAFWSGQATAPGEGVEIDSLTFSNWAGTCVDGTKNPPIQFHCSDDYVCGSLYVDNFNVWTETGSSELYKCQNSYGIGACMNPFAGNGPYLTTMTVTAMATAKYSVPTMPAEAVKGLGITTSIDIPPVPTSFYPGLKPTSSLLGKA